MPEALAKVGRRLQALTQDSENSVLMLIDGNSVATWDCSQRASE